MSPDVEDYLVQPEAAYIQFDENYTVGNILNFIAKYWEIRFADLRWSQNFMKICLKLPNHCSK